jgi:predicted NBD/HSP70 family sugar kinase
VDRQRCGCGGYGCLQAIVGRAGIARRARHALKLAGRGVLEETGQYLGVGISNAINFLNPEVVVLGGSTVEVGEMVMIPLTRVAKKRRCLAWWSG